MFDIFSRKSEPENKPEADMGKTEGSAIKNIPGYSGLRDMRNAAPASTSGIEPPQKNNRSAPASRPQLSKAESEKAIKDLQRQQNMQRMAEHIMRKCATMPYDTWAILANDKHYKLTPEEGKELAEEYVDLANTVEIDFTRPIWLFIGIAAAHAAFVGDRLKYMVEKADKLDAEKQSKLNEKDHPKVN